MIEKARKGAPGELVQGTLDMLILKTTSRGALHGYAIAEFIERTSDAILRVEEGAHLEMRERHYGDAGPTAGAARDALRRVGRGSLHVCGGGRPPAADRAPRRVPARPARGGHRPCAGVAGRLKRFLI